MAKTSGGIRRGRDMAGYRKGDEWFTGYTNLHRRQNVRAVFNAIQYSGVPSMGESGKSIRSYTYLDRGYGANILNAVAKHGSGAARDIARRFGGESTQYLMSDKQTWSVSYAFLKLKPKQV